MVQSSVKLVALTHHRRAIELVISSALIRNARKLTESGHFAKRRCSDMADFVRNGTSRRFCARNRRLVPFRSQRCARQAVAELVRVQCPRILTNSATDAWHLVVDCPSAMTLFRSACRESGRSSRPYTITGSARWRFQLPPTVRPPSLHQSH